MASIDRLKELFSRSTTAVNVKCGGGHPDLMNSMLKKSHMINDNYRALYQKLTAERPSGLKKHFLGRSNSSCAKDRSSNTLVIRIN